MKTQKLIRNTDDMQTIVSSIELLEKVDNFDVEDLFKSINQYANVLGKEFKLSQEGVKLTDLKDDKSPKVRKEKRDDQIVSTFLEMRKSSPNESTTRLSLTIGQNFGLSDRAVQKILRARNVWTSSRAGK